MTSIAGNNAWDTHVHLFDSFRFPYRFDRAYTPPAASVDELIIRSRANNFMLVQATIEADSLGLISQLQALTKRFPQRTFRGEVLFEKTDVSENHRWSDENLQILHEAGVRCLRISGRFDDSTRGTEAVVENIKSILMLAVQVARKHRWTIAMQQPLQIWSSLMSFIENEMADVHIIAEHCASVNVPLSSPDLTAFDDLCKMLEKKLIYVKLGALHRRRGADREHGEMKDVLAKLTMSGPTQLIWGSDWPHVDSTALGLCESKFLEVDEVEELEIIRQAMSGVTGAYDKMLEGTPAFLFE